MASNLNIRNAAGALLFIGGVQAIITLIAAETLFPGYNTRQYDLSDLASTVPPNTSPVQPSATMFNSLAFVLGLMVLISAYLIHRAYGKRLFTVLFAIFGVAGMLVGLFPGDTREHGWVALLWFVFGPLSAIVAYKLENRSLGYFSIVIGVWALFALSMRIFTFFLGGGSLFLSM